MKTNSSSNLLFYVLIRSWRSMPYLRKCIDSVISQNYKRYRILFVDDASGYSVSVRNYIQNRLKGHVAVFNDKRQYSVRNAYDMIYHYANEPEAVVVNLDGDDWFDNNNVLSYINKIYVENQYWLTYGNCFMWNKRTTQAINKFDAYANRAYSKKTIQNNSFRLEPFRCSHPRTWKVWLYKKIKKDDFLRPDKTWLEFAEDQVMFYPMLEMAGDRSAVLTKILSVYNIANSLGDSKRNPIRLVSDELVVRRKHPYGRIY